MLSSNGINLHKTDIIHVENNKLPGNEILKKYRKFKMCNAIYLYFKTNGIL